MCLSQSHLVSGRFATFGLFESRRGKTCFEQTLYSQDVYQPVHRQKFLEDCMLTRPCIVDTLTPHFYIVKLGFTGVYIIFLFLL